MTGSRCREARTGVGTKDRSTATTPLKKGLIGKILKTTKGNFLSSVVQMFVLKFWHSFLEKNTPPEILNVRAAALTINSNLASPAYLRPYFTCITWHNVAKHLLPGWQLTAALFLRSLFFQRCLFKPTKLPNLLMRCSSHDEETSTPSRPSRPRRQRPIPHKRRRMWVW